MTRKNIEVKYNVSILKTRYGWYEAYEGGNGTGQIVRTLAKATTLETLALRLDRLLAKIS